MVTFFRNRSDYDPRLPSQGSGQDDVSMTINLALGDDKTRRNWGVGDASIANKLGSLSIIYMVRYYIAS